MTYTFPNSAETDGLQKRSGRPPTADDLSPQAVRMAANRVEQKGLSDYAWHVIELLAHLGVMSDEQLSFLVKRDTLEK